MFVIQLMKRRLMHVYAFRFCTSSFFTHDICEYAKMKQFTLVTCNIRSQYTLFCKSRWIFKPKITVKTCYSAELELLS